MELIQDHGEPRKDEVAAPAPAPAATLATPQGTTQISVVCPHCKKGFFHKIGHFFSSVGTEAVEAAVDIALPPGAMGRD
jgi:hypothetical protein